MTETTPVLAYRMNEYGRRPFLIVLAITTIIFGLLVIGASIFVMIEWRSRFSSGPGAFPRPVIVNLMTNGVLSILRWVVLIGCAVAFLTRSRHVALFLSAYFCISIGNALLAPALKAWTDFATGGGYGLFQTMLGSIAGIAYSVIDLVMLMLLQVREVRQVILAMTAAREQSF